jgi:hypothetical protein
MNSSDSNRALGLFVVAAFLAGCGGTQLPLDAPGPRPLQAQKRLGAPASAILPLRLSRSLGYKATAPLLYATDTGTFKVTVYPAKASDPAPLATISQGLDDPVGDCIDSQGTLYVVNSSAGNGWVSEYPIGTTTPS